MKRFLVLCALLALVILAGCAKRAPIGPLGGIHTHADYKVYLDGKPVDFRKAEYMVKAQYVHIEGMNGDVIHFHATGVTMGEFFRTLGMKFTNECFVNKKKYCTNEEKTLKFFVNGEANELYGDYLTSDKDKMLISYGNDSPEEIQKQIASVTNHSIAESSSGRTMRLG